MTDRGLMISGGDQTLGLYRKLVEADLPGIVELLPADGSLLVVLRSAGEIPGGLQEILNAHLEAENVNIGQQHQISVRFDGEDLNEVAEQAALSKEGLIELVCSLDLHIEFLGFQPGFAYLEGLPRELHMPRLAVPRKHVPKGSLALGGGYCGIYPAAGPGGWHLIGTTDTEMFNPESRPPALLQPGDTVRFVAT